MTSPEKFGLPDASVEGTLSSTVSPKTLPSADDNLQLDESWPQLLHNMMAGFPMDGSLLYPYAKELPSTDAFIVEEGAALPQEQGLSDIPSEQFVLPNVPHGLPFSNGSLAEPVSGAEPLPRQMQGSVAMGPNPISQAQNPMHPHETPWLDNLETQLPSTMTSPTSFSNLPQPSLFAKDEITGQDMFQYKSENSSVSDGIPSTYDFSYTATGDDVPAFADRQLDEENLWKAEKEESSSEEYGPQKATAFVVSEDPEPLFSTVPENPRNSPLAQPAPARPQALAAQSGAIKKRKKRNPSVALSQENQKPLQIVQEDGQGGAIASADFVSPPRGARRKGPLSMAGRANAGMRRKNKDTCVQCRLNKRKVIHFLSTKKQ